MSVRAMSWAFEQRLATPGEKIVLVALANFADEAGFCFPSQATLAIYASMTERSVRRVLDELEAGGHMAREGRPGKGRKLGYRLVGMGVAVEVPPVRLTPAGEAEADAQPDSLAGHDGGAVEAEADAQPDTVTGHDGGAVEAEATGERPLSPVRPDIMAGSPIPPYKDDPSLIQKARASQAPEAAAAAPPAPSAPPGDEAAWQRIAAVLPRRPGDDDREIRIQWALAIEAGTSAAEIQRWAHAYAEQVKRERTKPYYLLSAAKWIKEKRWRDFAGNAPGYRPPVIEEGLDPAFVDEWRVARVRLAAWAGPVMFRAWLEGLALVSIDAGEIELGAKSAFVRDHVKLHYLGKIEQITARRVEIVIQSPPADAAPAGGA